MSRCGAFDTIRLPRKPRRSGSGPSRRPREKSRGIDAVCRAIDPACRRPAAREAVAHVTRRRQDLRSTSPRTARMWRSRSLRASDLVGRDQTPGRRSLRRVARIALRASRGDLASSHAQGASRQACRCGSRWRPGRGSRWQLRGILAAAQMQVEQLAAMAEHPVVVQGEHDRDPGGDFSSRTIVVERHVRWWTCATSGGSSIEPLRQPRGDARVVVRVGEARVSRKVRLTQRIRTPSRRSSLTAYSGRAGSASRAKT